MIKALSLLLVFVAVIGIIIAGVTRKRWQGDPPQVAFSRDFKALGRTPALTEVDQ